MKRKIGRILLMIPVCLILLLVGAILSKKARAEEAAEKIKSLPRLVMSDIHGRAFNTDSLSGPLLITFFHPDCEHCQYEISAILSNKQVNEKLTPVFVSHAGRTDIDSFVLQQGIAESKVMYIIHDPELRLNNLFRANVIPANFIYDDSLRLVKVIKGSVRPDAILKYLKKQ
ncbi:MAG: hypothetical protein R2758_00810 [Bacteroidales bacterium]